MHKNNTELSNMLQYHSLHNPEYFFISWSGYIISMTTSIEFIISALLLSERTISAKYTCSQVSRWSRQIQTRHAFMPISYYSIYLQF